MPSDTVASHKSRAAPALHVWILILGVLGTLTLAGWSHALTLKQMQAELRHAGSDFARDLGSRVQSYIDTLPGLRVFVLLNRSPNDAEFRRYVQTISLKERFPGLALTFLIQRVPASEREAFLRDVRNDTSLHPGGRPGFTIQPPGERAEYLVLRHAYPEDPGGLGYDLLDASRNYRADALRAAETGAVVATGPLRLAKDRERVDDPTLTNVVVRTAIYQSEEAPSTPAQRVDELRALAGVSFNTTELVRSAYPDVFARLGATVQIVDVQAEASAAAALVFDSRWPAGGPSPGALDPGEVDFVQRVRVADREWRISIDAQPGLAWAHLGLSTWTLLLAGLGLTLLGWLAARAQFQARTAAETGFERASRELAAEQRQLVASEGRYRSLFENSMDGVLQSRPTGEVLAANPAACALLGRTQDEICALGREGLLDMDDPRAGELIRMRDETGSAQGVLRFKRPDGTTFEAEVASRIYTDHDGRVAASISFRDVTERQELLARQARMIAIIEATPDLVVSFDLQGRVVFMNASARQRAGLGLNEDPAGLSFNALHLPCTARRLAEEAIPQAMRTGLWSGQLMMRGARDEDGEEPALVVVLGHRLPGGQVAYLSSVARSLKDVLQAQQERDEIEALLRQSQRLESLGTLAGGIAHDFNNVLAAIIGNAAMAQDALEARHPVAGQVALILKAALRARSLVQQILTFSRRGLASRSVQALQPLVQEAVALLKSTVPPSVEIALDMSRDPLNVAADPAQIHQVVMNLCTNAWQALPSGRGDIKVRVHPAPAAAEPLPDAAAGQACVRIEVEDNGVGMDEATQRRIFEPFFTTKQVGQGTGLGLSVVHGIVTGMGGRIQVHSHPGMGTRFVLDLPCARASATPAEASAAPVAQGRGETVLYIDDDDVVALTLEAMLARLGYQPVRYANGHDALAALSRNPKAFAAILTDYNMPGLSGLDVAQMARVLAPEVPVLMTSGYVTDELRWSAAAAGVSSVLLKEHSLEQLGPELHRALADAAVLRRGSRALVP